MSRYSGKRAVVVGGTHGIGLAIARQLRDEGAEVLVTGRSETTIDGIESVVSDVTDAADRAALTERAGAIDALFVNVGLVADAPYATVTEAEWDRQFDVTAKGAFFVAQALAPQVRAGGGIVFTTLMRSTAMPGAGLPFGAKAAVREIAYALAAELVTEGVRVNTVAPGYIDTPTFGIATATDDERMDLKEAGRTATPMGRLGEADEVAKAAIFLALEATFTTGTELQVDGGISGIVVPRGS